MSNDTPQPMSVEDILNFPWVGQSDDDVFDVHYLDGEIECIHLKNDFKSKLITALNELRRADMEYVIGEDMRPNPYLANVNPQEVGNRLRNIQRARINERLRSEDLSPTPQQQ